MLVFRDKMIKCIFNNSLKSNDMKNVCDVAYFHCVLYLGNSH